MVCPEAGTQALAKPERPGQAGPMVLPLRLVLPEAMALMAKVMMLLVQHFSEAPPVWIRPQVLSVPQVREPVRVQAREPRVEPLPELWAGA